MYRNLRTVLTCAYYFLHHFGAPFGSCIADAPKPTPEAPDALTPAELCCGSGVGAMVPMVAMVAMNTGGLGPPRSLVWPLGSHNCHSARKVLMRKQCLFESV